MPRSANTHLVTVGPMTETEADGIARILTQPEHQTDLLGGQRVTVVTGIDTVSPSLRLGFTGGELEMIAELAASCWAVARNGALGRPHATERQARLAMRAYYRLNGMPPPTAAQLREAHNSDFW